MRLGKFNFHLIVCRCALHFPKLLWQPEKAEKVCVRVEWCVACRSRDSTASKLVFPAWLFLQLALRSVGAQTESLQLTAAACGFAPPTPVQHPPQPSPSSRTNRSACVWALHWFYGLAHFNITTFCCVFWLRLTMRQMQSFCCLSGCGFPLWPSSSRKMHHQRTYIIPHSYVCVHK